MLNKSVLFAVWIGTIGYGAMNPAHAQGLPPDDGGFELETADDISSSGGLLENLSQYVGATMGANSGTSDAVEKSIQGISLVFDLPSIGNVKSFVSVDVGNYENVYKLELNGFSKNRLNDCQQQGLNPDNALNSGSFDANIGGVPNERYVQLGRLVGPYARADSGRQLYRADRRLRAVGADFFRNLARWTPANRAGSI